jgi:hypothetical protein
MNTACWRAHGSSALDINSGRTMRRGRMKRILVMCNVRHKIVGPIGDSMKPYDKGIEAEATYDPISGVELSREGHEFIVSFVLERDFDFHKAADPENEDGVFSILEVLGLCRLTLIQLCQAAHSDALKMMPSGTQAPSKDWCENMADAAYDSIEWLSPDDRQRVINMMAARNIFTHYPESQHDLWTAVVQHEVRNLLVDASIAEYRLLQSKRRAA